MISISSKFTEKQSPPWKFPDLTGLIPENYNPYLDPDYKYKIAKSTTGCTPVVIRSYEKFKPYPYDNNYMVSNMGTVYSHSKERQLTVHEDEDGYYRVYVGRPRGLHTAIMETFHPNPDPDKYDQINHDDGHKHNNYYLGPKNTNLFWSNTQDNINHAIDKGLRYHDGEQSVTAKINNETAHAICRLIALGYTGRQIALELGMPHTPQFQDRITKIRRGESWRSISVQYGIDKIYGWYDERLSSPIDANTPIGKVYGPAPSRKRMSPNDLSNLDPNDPIDAYLMSFGDLDPNWPLY